MSTIIRKALDIFIPEQYNGNYLLPTTIVGITLEKTAVIATIIKLSGTTITIESHTSLVLSHTITHKLSLPMMPFDV